MSLQNRFTKIAMTTAVATFLLGSASMANAAADVTTQDVRNLVGESCVGILALYDPAGYSRGKYNGQNDQICGCAVEGAMKAGFSEKQVKLERYSKKLRLISGSHDAIRVLTDRCGKKLLGDDAPKVIKEPKPTKNW